MKDNEVSLRQTWEQAAIGEHFSQEPQPATNRLGEDGFSVLIPPTGEPLAAITVFPQSRNVRVRTANTDIYLRNASAPLLTGSGIHIETDDGSTNVLVTHAGGVAVQSFPMRIEPLESPTGIPDAKMGERLDSQTLAAPGGVQREIPASDEPSATAQPEGQERQPKMKWTGYVANDPLFGTTRDGAARANFIVSEHLEDDKTVYHKVYTSKKEAERLKDAGLAKGNRVRVEGYRQERPRQHRDGTTTIDPRVYAVHVTIYKPGEAPASPPPNTDLPAQEK